MAIKTLLIVGRVSNLPTVWTNILAAAILAQAGLNPTLAGGYPEPVLWLGTLLALSTMYLGGMFLNDAFDADWDKQNNPSRPIAAGQISARTVWVIGIGLVLFSVIIIGYLYQSTLVQQYSINRYQQHYGWLAGVLLASTIIAYNAWHKQFAHSAFIMGACRFGVYLVAALLLAELTFKVTLVALSLLLYIAGLTYLARQEHLNKITRLWPLLLLFSPVAVALLSGFDSLYFWLYLVGFVGWVVSRLRFVLGAQPPNVKACIGGLLAAIPLLDGLMLASVDALIPSLICLLVFFIIPGLHRWVSGT
ncbi:MAG: 4-hydroxybenzoate polyprenyltransferase [Alteromonadaceae bacterium]|jgi:4-hydroxybenzoate polyprenyltransferase